MSLKGTLKWAFKIAVWGVGIGIGSELVTEFLTYGMLHGASPLSTELAHLSKEFTAPLMAWANDAIGGEAGLSWFKSLLKATHEFFGVTGTFAPAIPASIDGLPGATIPGLEMLSG